MVGNFDAVVLVAKKLEGDGWMIGLEDMGWDE